MGAPGMPPTFGALGLARGTAVPELTPDGGFAIGGSAFLVAFFSPPEPAGDISLEAGPARPGPARAGPFGGRAAAGAAPLVDFLPAALTKAVALLLPALGMSWGLAQFLHSSGLGAAAGAAVRWGRG